jgi:cobyrinic acid a,c-diamide synthase
MDGKREGLCRYNIFAGFTHLHALGAPEWAHAIIGKARQHRAERQNKIGSPSRKKRDAGGY